MPQLLLELFSEEIPARMQAQAARDLERMARESLAAAGLLPEALTSFAGPRRLTLVAEGLPTAQPDRREELKGPRIGAPDQAIEGFLRKAGLNHDQLVERDGVYMALIERPGRPTPQIVAEMVEAIVRGFPWPKSMTSGYSKMRWVRPLKRILCVFEREVVPFSIEGIDSGDLTQGHRFMGDPAPFRARDFDEYREGLAKHFVVLAVDERKERILHAARTLCFARNLELVEDEALLDEVAGLAEWPTPLLGDMDPDFLDLPPEVIRTSMRTHQKYFAVRDPASGKLAPHFIVVANIAAADGGALIAAGNAKVLSARLSDARFFWDEDRKVGFEPWLEKLKGVTFHAKLGTMAQRVERITELAREIAPRVGADSDQSVEAARLAKADLASLMVGEFPELQGVMGRYYALEPFPLEGGRAGMGVAPTAASGDSDAPSGSVSTPIPDPSPLQGEGRAAIADAIAEHYRPQGPNDALPGGPIAAAVALADKLDMLVTFFAIDERPTGSRDPFALRRAALGVIRLLLERQVRLPLQRVVGPVLDRLQAARRNGSVTSPIVDAAWYSISDQLLAFFADRLKVALKDQGKRGDLVDAVFALGDDDLVRIVARVEALTAFLATDDGANLLAGFKRASNILKAEEKKGELPQGEPEPRGDAPVEEQNLIAALNKAKPAVDNTLAKEDFAGAMTALAALRGPVDAFFEKVLVNDPDVAVRDNRLRLLAQVRNAMGRVAEFSLVAG